MTVATPAVQTEVGSMRRAMLAVAASACGFGSIPVLTSLAMAAGMTLTSVLGWRYALAAVGLALLARLLATAGPWPSNWRRILVLGGGGQAAVAFVSLSALRYLPPATLTFLFYTYPAWIAVIAAMRGHEPITRGRAAALALSLAGIALMVLSPATTAAPDIAGGSIMVGVALALGSALLYALYVPMLGRLQGSADPARVSTFVIAGAAICFIGGGLATGTFDHAPPAGGWPFIGLLVVFSTVLAFVLFLRGLRTLGPVRTAIVSTVEPFWAAVLGAAVGLERLTPATIAGGVMIGVAVLLLQRAGGAAPAVVSAVARE